MLHPTSPHNPPGIPETAKPALVLDHRDGKTLVVQIGEQRKAVVLIGLDVPDPKAKPAGECYGQESLERLRKVVPVGSTVYLEAGVPDRDRQRRLLRYVWLAGDEGKKPTLVNQKMIRDGYAAYAGIDVKGPDYADRLREAQERAQEGNRGLWKACGSPHKRLPVPLGTTVRVDSWDITVRGTQVRESVGSFNPQLPRGIYVVVFFEVTNLSNSPQVFRYERMRLTDSTGRTFGVDSTALIFFIFEELNIQGPYQELQPSLTYQTGVVFDVPRDANGFVLDVGDGQLVQLDR